MDAEKHAKALRIFSFIYSAIQLVFSLLVGAYVLLSIVAMLIVYNELVPAQLYIWAAIYIVLSFAALVGLVTAILNFRQAVRLGKRDNASRALVIVTSIANIVSFLSVGIVILPVGLALGIYGVWFAFSQTGRSFLRSKGTNYPHFHPAYVPAIA
jgi:hypothetical protein